jgi:hypothetical protein
MVILLVAPVQAFSQESLESKVRDLEVTVQLLESRVTSLEAEPREQSAPASVPPGKESWRKLRHGMSEAAVEALLGSPSKIVANEDYFIWWYRETAIGRVEFDTRSRKVKEWSEPY